MQVKRLKTHDHHFDLTYRNVFYSLDWMKIIDHLITDFNKLTLEEEEENTGKQKEQISNTTQDNDIDVL